jgi:hypothetical protein
MNSGKPPLYPRRCSKQVIHMPSRKRKAEDHQVTVVKRSRLCYNRKRKREDNIAIVPPFKRTRLGEDQEEMLFGLRILKKHDATDIVCHNATDSSCHDFTDIEKKVQTKHLGSIWFPHATYGLVRRSLRVSQLGSTWVSHPKYGLLRRSGRISASSP